MEAIVAQLDSPSNVNKFIESSLAKLQDLGEITKFSLEISQVFEPIQNIQDWNAIREQDLCPEKKYVEFPVVFLANELCSIGENCIPIVRLLVGKFKIFFSGVSGHLIEHLVRIAANFSSKDHWADVCAIADDCSFEGNDFCFESLVFGGGSQLEGSSSNFQAETIKLLCEWIQMGTISLSLLSRCIPLVPNAVWEAVLRNQKLNEAVFASFLSCCAGSVERISLLFVHLPRQSEWKQRFVLHALQQSIEGSLAFWFCLLGNFKWLEDWMQKILIHVMQKAARIVNDAWKALLAVHFLSLFDRKSLSATSRNNVEANHSASKNKNVQMPHWMQQFMHRNAQILCITTPERLPYSNNAVSQLYWTLDLFCRVGKLDESVFGKNLPLWEREFNSNSAFHWLIVYKLKVLASKKPSQLERTGFAIGKVREFLQTVARAKETGDCEKIALPTKVTLEHLFEMDQLDNLTDEQLLEQVKQQLNASSSFIGKLKRLLQ